MHSRLDSILLVIKEPDWDPYGCPTPPAFPCEMLASTPPPPEARVLPKLAVQPQEKISKPVESEMPPTPAKKSSPTPKSSSKRPRSSKKASPAQKPTESKSPAAPAPKPTAEEDSASSESCAKKKACVIQNCRGTPKSINPTCNLISP